MQSLSKSDGTRRSLERRNPVEDLTPVNSLRHKQRSMDREDDLFQDRIRRSPVAGIIAFRSGSATTAPIGCDVVENDRRLSGRRSADAISDRQSSAYEEALNRELLRDDLSEADRQQVKYSLARVKYHKSLVMYASAKSLERQSSRSPDGRFSESPSKMYPPKAVLSCEVLNRSSPVASVPRRNFSPSTTDAPSRGSPHSRISPHTERYSPARSWISPQEERYSSPARSGGLTVTVSPANRYQDLACETHQPMWKSTSGESLLIDGRRRFQKKYRTVVDISSSGSDRSVSPHQNSRRGGSKRRVVRRRASDRHRHRYSDPKVDGSDMASKLAVNGAVNLGRSRSDASDVVSRVSDRYKSDRSVPRANESVNLLVTTTSSPVERPAVLNNSDALSVSSDSTFTGNDAKTERRRMTAINERVNETKKRGHTMKDRPWHRELVMQYLDPPTQYAARSNTTTSRYVTRPRGAATVVYLPPLPRSHDITSGRGGSSSANLHKPTTSSRPLHTSSSYHSALPDLRSRDSSYARSGHADAGRRNGSGDLTRFPYSLGASDGRSGRRPSVPVAVECANSRSAAHKPRPAIETRRPPNPVSDLPNINWSVSKLRERYAGGSGGGPGTSPGNQKSSVTTVKVDKTDSSKPITSRIGAVQRLL